MCPNTLPRGKDIRHGLRETIISAHQPEKGCETILKRFGIKHFTVRKIYKWKTFKTVSNFSRNGQPRKLPKD